MSQPAGLDRVPLGIVMAGAFAAALAFALYAMPAWRLEGAVVASGLPGLLGAAEPPLGSTARALVMLVGALAGGLAVYALFRWIERPRAPHRFARVTRALKPRVVPGGPTLRRADAHPDAPARRPIFAAADLGAPLDAAPPLAAAMPELLLDAPIAEPETAAGLLARLETGLARRAAPPIPDARLRDSFARAVNG